MHFRNIQDRVAWIDVLEVVHNAALNKGGSLIICEFLIDDARRIHLPGFLMSLNMLIQTRGGLITPEPIVLAGHETRAFPMLASFRSLAHIAR